MSAANEALDAGGLLVLVDELHSIIETLDLNMKVSALAAVAGIVVADHTAGDQSDKRPALVGVFAKHIASCADTVVRNRAMEAAHVH